jgi:PAS domain S-box-containing protein
LLHRGGQSIRRLFKIDDWVPCCSLHAHTLLHPLCDIIDPQPAGVQDRDGAVPVLRLSRRSFPFMTKAFADGGYAGDKPASAAIIANEILRKPPDQVGFAALRNLGGLKSSEGPHEGRRHAATVHELGSVILVYPDQGRPCVAPWSRTMPGISELPTIPFRIVRPLPEPFQFLPSGGRMGAEIRAHDWSATSLGPPDRWPPALRVRLAQMLLCPTAMFLAWGPELLCFYNDAYIPILGYRQSNALGQPFREVWASIWEEIEPLVRATLSGESQTLTDVMLDLSREGRPEQSWWSFTYSPALDDAGAVNGLFCVTGETTDRVLSVAALRESEDHFRHTVELNPQVPWTCDPDGSITSYSNRWLEITGQAPGEPLGSGWVKALHPEDADPATARFASALATGEPVDVDYRVRMAATGDFRWMRARAYPRRDEAGVIVRWYGVVEDVHDPVPQAGRGAAAREQRNA